MSNNYGNYGISKINANVKEYTNNIKSLENLNNNKNVQPTNKTDASKSVEKKPTLNLDNEIKISVKNTKLPEFKPTINFLSNDKNMSDSLKTQETGVIKESVDLKKANNNINLKIAEEILKNAISQ